MVFSVIALTGAASAAGIYQSGSVGTDVSWPNCSAKAPSTAFGIVGVTGGLGFSPNTCLTKELSWFKNQSLYVNTGYPGQSYGQKYKNYPNICTDTDLNCLAYNYGYAAGQYAVNYAASQNVSSTTWWLDVETMNSWTSDVNQNKNSLQGEADALKNAGVTTLGYYSTTAQWQTITGGWQNGLPSWGATTWTTAKQAAKYCNGHEFTGGPTWLIQFSGKLDQNYAC
ncbi:hypothetical protein KW803_02365 [Candidatus Saccharibacteria bacterium]|nr:hypothetical protein [Candidatus Saccharibacteria bacterium]